MKIRYFILTAIMFCFIYGCNKIVEVDPPVNTIVSEQAFATDANATRAILGIYSSFANQSLSYQFAFGNGGLSIIGGISSDELGYIRTDATFAPIYKNQILSNNSIVLTRLWTQPYGIIYQANACLEQLENSKNVSSPLREQLIGEARFFRAFTYFYLANYFGDVPYLTSTDYKSNSLAPRMGVDSVYQNITKDLEQSLNDLTVDFSSYGNQRIRVTKWAAASLLARIYLFAGDWDKADQYSSMVINSTLFNIVPNLNTVFLKNSTEAIFQTYVDPTLEPYNVLLESYVTIPYNRTSRPFIYYQPTFVSQFDSSDNRRKFWIDSTIYNGTTYYIPYKYKVGPSQSSPSLSPTEYYMVLRLAEQYLIRAEARAQKGDLVGAAQDVNILRSRAGLGAISFISKDDAINKIIIERQKELMYEWGNRWLDIKRTGKIDQLMSNFASQKGSSWRPEAKLFPLPSSEVLSDPNLTQNTGYN